MKNFGLHFCTFFLIVAYVGVTDVSADNSRPNCAANISACTLAANLGDLDAIIELGDAYLTGNGTDKDYTLALVLFRKAAAKGDTCAQHNIAYIYDNGFGVDEDIAIALKWYRKPAEQGNSSAIASLAGMYEDGRGVEQNHQKSVDLYQQAANQEHALAQ